MELIEKCSFGKKITKHLFLLFLFAITVFFTNGCQSHSEKNKEKCYCDSIANKIIDLSNEYEYGYFKTDSAHMEEFLDTETGEMRVQMCYDIGEEPPHDEAYLDSIIMLVDENESICRENMYGMVFPVTRVIAYSMKRDYQKSLNYAEALDENTLVLGEAQKCITINRIKAMAAQQNGDFETRNYHVSQIVDMLEKEIPASRIDFILKHDLYYLYMNPGKIIFIKQYFYYLAQIKGFDIVQKENSSRYHVPEESIAYDIIMPQEDDFMDFRGF